MYALGFALCAVTLSVGIAMCVYAHVQQQKSKRFYDEMFPDPDKRVSIDIYDADDQLVHNTTVAGEEDLPVWHHWAKRHGYSIQRV